MGLSDIAGRTDLASLPAAGLLLFVIVFGWVAVQLLLTPASRLDACSRMPLDDTDRKIQP